MSERRAALVERFRGSALRRIERARTVLGARESVAESELAEVLGELHTVKGESRMLGLRPVAEAPTGAGRHAHPSSTSRLSLMPKWWATSCSTVVRTRAASACSSSARRQWESRKIVMRSGAT